MLTLARSVSEERGELALLRRADGTLELRVNGLFAMDTAETTSERLLASRALASIDAATAGLSVLVGGLGLGFTVAAVLDDTRVARVVVAELEPDLVRWHRDGIVDSKAGMLDDARVEVVVADVREVVADQAAGTLDLVLLDVDNGPGFLLHAANAPIYREPFLAACSDGVRPGGTVAIWSASESTALDDAVRAVFDDVDVHAIPVTLNTRSTHYHLYLGRTSWAEGVGHAG